MNSRKQIYKKFCIKIVKQMLQQISVIKVIINKCYIQYRCKQIIKMKQTVQKTNQLQLINKSQQNSKNKTSRQTTKHNTNYNTNNTNTPNNKELNINQHHNNKSSQLSQLQQSTNILLNKRIVSPQKLKILVLSGNQLQNNQLQFLSKCINLIKLDLSHNHISRLIDRFGIQNINNLRLLNLQGNKLISIQSIQVIFGMNSLQILNYKQNPLQQNAKSQHFIVNGLVNLKIINNRIIFVQQRDPYMLSQRKNEYIDNDFEQWQATQHSQRYYLKVLKLQLQYIDNMWMFNNPVVKIQRIFKILLQQSLSSHKQTIINNNHNNISHLNYNHNLSQSPLITQKYILLSCFRQWKNMTETIKLIKQQLKQTQYISNQNNINLLDSNNKSLSNSNHSNNSHFNHYNNSNNKLIILENKQYLTYELQQYYLMKRNIKIKNQYQIFLQKIRFKIYLKKMVQIFKRNIKLRQLSFSDPLTSYYKVSGLSSTKKIYFSRVQQHLIQNFLAHIAKNFNKKIQIQTKGHFGVANQYIAVRLMDPDTYSSKTVYNPLTYLLWPCMRSVILKKKKFPYKQRSSLIKLRSLTYIKNLNKRLTPSQRTKSNKTYARIDKFFQHEYNEALGYFQCQDEFVFQQLIRMIYYHNTKALNFQKIIQRSQMMSLLQSYTQNVSIYTQRLLQRTTSAVKIQQQWRRYINNKKQKQGIYQKLKKNRASRLIQRFLRDRVFYHRLAFQRNLSLDLTAYDDNDIIIHSNLYMKLPYIIQQSSKHIQLYKGFKVVIKDTIKLYHSQFSNKQVFSPKLRQLHLSENKFSIGDQSPPSSSQSKIDIYRFFHQNSNVKIIQCKGQKFYQFTYKKIEDSKLRIACLALLTYKIYGGYYMLLLSKSTLHMYNQHIKCYKKYEVDCKPFAMTCQEQNANKLRVNIVCDISQQARCQFLYLDIKYEVLFSKSDLSQKIILPVQFYQKKYQDYPQKYSSLLKIIEFDEQQIKQKQIQQKFLNIQKMLIKQSQLRDNQNQQFQRVNKNNTIPIKDSSIFKTTKVNIITPSIQFSILNNINTFYDNQPKSMDQSLIKTKNLSKLQMSIKKTSQQHLSLYQIDNSFKDQPQPSKLFKTIIQEIQTTKKDKVTKFLQQSKEKKTFFKQKKQIDLGQVREKRKFQKAMNMTLKSFNQTQRTQQLKKKAEKVKQYKRRSLSQNKAQQGQFMQQGNFIMEQQLKMNLMRNRIKQVQKLRQKRNSLPKSLNNTQSLHHYSQQTKSIKSNQSLRQNKILFEGKDIQLIDFDKKVMPSASMQQHSYEIFGGQTQIVNKRSYVKKRSSKIGAYLRDPSLVHGVFPQQYYPIETGKGGIMFPRVG